MEFGKRAEFGLRQKPQGEEAVSEVPEFNAAQQFALLDDVTKEQLSMIARGAMGSQGNTGNPDNVLRKKLHGPLGGEAKVDALVSWLIANPDNIKID